MLGIPLQYGVSRIGTQVRRGWHWEIRSTPSRLGGNPNGGKMIAGIPTPNTDLRPPRRCPRCRVRGRKVRLYLLEHADGTSLGTIAICEPCHRNLPKQYGVAQVPIR